MSDLKPTGDKGISRREFIGNPLKRVLKERDSLQESGVFRLADLGDLPDEVMAALKPKVVPNCKISIEQEQVMATVSFPLFPVQDDMVIVFNHFNGKQTIAEISQLVASRLEIDYVDAFSVVREVFVNLALRQICAPSEPPESIW